MDILNRLILFLIRRKFHLKVYEGFQFTNQKSNAVYYFTKSELIKYEHGGYGKSHVSLNWLLSKECAVSKTAYWLIPTNKNIIKECLHHEQKS